MKTKTIKQKEQEAFKAMKDQFGYTNVMSAPKLVKVAVNAGTGSGVKRDKNRNEFVAGRLAKIVGQKASLRGAKKSIASFKLRQNDPIGVMATLRGARMYAFLDKLFNVAIPRTKDFRGLNAGALDDIGNLTLSIKEHTIFPETADEELKDVFGFAITLVTTAKNKKEARAFFDLLGVPFKQ